MTLEIVARPLEEPNAKQMVAIRSEFEERYRELCQMMEENMDGMKNEIGESKKHIKGMDKMVTSPPAPHPERNEGSRT